MYVSATTMQNNFGKYLKLCKNENVIITKNGKNRALLLYYPRSHDGYKDDINVVEPDLMVLRDPGKDVNEKDRYKGTPELVVEILSPSTRSKDMVKKLDLYMESGVVSVSRPFGGRGRAAGVTEMSTGTMASFSMMKKRVMR